MNFQSIDYIIATANEKSISKAAESLHISQQTLSAHIASVENEFGCKLFVRHIPLELTYAGEEFLKHARLIQLQVQNLKRTLYEISGNEKGVLRVGITDNRDRIILAPIILNFQSRHPGIELKVVECVNEILIEKLLKGELDVCISDFSIAHPGINLVDLYAERVVFIIQKKKFFELFGDQADTVIQKIQNEGDYHYFQDCPLLMGHERDISGKFSRHLISTLSRQPVIKMEAENMVLILELCVNGMGGCFCPEIIARNTLTAEQLEQVFIITLGKESQYKIRIGWKENWNILSSFVSSAKNRFSSSGETKK